MTQMIQTMQLFITKHMLFFMDFSFIIPVSE